MEEKPVILRARSRFCDITPQDLIKEHSPVTILGVGGVGGPIAESLARMGFDLVIWDPDTVGMENVGSQRYYFSDMENENGEELPDSSKPYKVDVIKERLERQCRVNVEVHPEKFLGQEVISGIVICSVDSLDDRCTIWESVKYQPISLYLDARVGGRNFVVFALNPFDYDKVERYESWTKRGMPVTERACTSKFAPEAGSGTDYVMTAMVTSFISGEEVPFRMKFKNFNIITEW